MKPVPCLSGSRRCRGRAQENSPWSLPRTVAQCSETFTTFEVQSLLSILLPPLRQRPSYPLNCLKSENWWCGQFLLPRLLQCTFFPYWTKARFCNLLLDYIMSWEGAQVHVSWRRESPENLSHPMYPFYFNNRSLDAAEITCSQAGVEEESLHLTILTAAYRIEH